MSGLNIIKANNRMIFNLDIMFLFEEVYSWHFRWMSLNKDEMIWSSGVNIMLVFFVIFRLHYPFSPYIKVQNSISSPYFKKFNVVPIFLKQFNVVTTYIIQCIMTWSLTQIYYIYSDEDNLTWITLNYFKKI